MNSAELRAKLEALKLKQVDLARLLTRRWGASPQRVWNWSNGVTKRVPSYVEAYLHDVHPDQMRAMLNWLRANRNTEEN